jgi:hypothetical protein
MPRCRALFADALDILGDGRHNVSRSTL